MALMVPPSMQCAALKHEVELRSGVMAARQALLHQCTLLPDGGTLGEAGVGPGSVVQVTLQTPSQLLTIYETGLPGRPALGAMVASELAPQGPYSSHETQRALASSHAVAPTGDPLTSIEPRLNLD